METTSQNPGIARTPEEAASALVGKVVSQVLILNVKKDRSGPVVVEFTFVDGSTFRLAPVPEYTIKISDSSWETRWQMIPPGWPEEG